MAPRFTVHTLFVTGTESLHAVEIETETGTERARVSGREITPGVWGFSSTFGATFRTFAEAVAQAVREQVRS